MYPLCKVYKGEVTESPIFTCQPYHYLPNLSKPLFSEIKAFNGKRAQKNNYIVEENKTELYGSMWFFRWNF